MTGKPVEPANAPAAAVSMTDVVQALSAHGIVRNYPKNAIIITAGDPSDSLYVILSGRVKVYLADDSG